MASSKLSDIDAPTRRQIERDLDEAQSRGITGSVEDVVASFEKVITDYLALAPEQKASYTRGETARIYGTALGEALVNDYDFEWKILADDYGTDLVVAQSADRFTAPVVVVDMRFDEEKPGGLTTFIGQLFQRFDL